MKDAVFLVKATDFEKNTLWHQHAKDSGLCGPVDWLDTGDTHIETVGYCLTQADHESFPIVVTLRWSTLNGRTVCFYHSTSLYVNWKMIEDWLEKNFTCRRCDASNFHLCLQHIKELNKPVCPLCGEGEWPGRSQGEWTVYGCGTMTSSILGRQLVQSPMCKKLPKIKKIVTRMSENLQSGVMDELMRLLCQ